MAVKKDLKNKKTINKAITKNIKSKIIKIKI